MSTEYKVAIAEISPLIMDRGGHYEGFEIDLWEAIARRLKISFVYEPHRFVDIVPLLADRKADIGLAGMTMTAAREAQVDFSHPTLDSGLLVVANRNRNKQGVIGVVRTLVHDGTRLLSSAVLGVALFVTVFGHMIWYVERGVHTFSATYVPGIFEAFWFVLTSMSTEGYGDFVPHTWLGRMITLVVIVAGVAVFGLLVAEVTSFLTDKRAKGDINGHEDLAGKRVGVVTDTTSEMWVRGSGAKVFGAGNTDGVYQKLKHGDVDAIVLDATTAEYREKKDSKKVFEIVGEIFDRQNYGIAVQPKSPLREEINRALLTLRESGEYERIYRKWFGENPSMV